MKIKNSNDDNKTPEHTARLLTVDYFSPNEFTFKKQMSDSFFHQNSNENNNANDQTNNIDSYKSTVFNPKQLNKLSINNFSFETDLIYDLLNQPISPKDKDTPLLSLPYMTEGGGYYVKTKNSVMLPSKRCLKKTENKNTINYSMDKIRIKMKSKLKEQKALLIRNNTKNNNSFIINNKVKPNVDNCSYARNASMILLNEGTKIKHNQQFCNKKTNDIIDKVYNVYKKPKQVIIKDKSQKMLSIIQNTIKLDIKNKDNGFSKLHIKAKELLKYQSENQKYYRNNKKVIRETKMLIKTNCKAKITDNSISLNNNKKKEIIKINYTMNRIKVINKQNNDKRKNDELSANNKVLELSLNTRTEIIKKEILNKEN